MVFMTAARPLGRPMLANSLRRRLVIEHYERGRGRIDSSCASQVGSSSSLVAIKIANVVTRLIVSLYANKFLRMVEDYKRVVT